MFKKMLVAAAGALIALSAFAFDRSEVQNSIELKDGSTVHILKNGKMAMESKYGSTVSMKPGQVMETKDGQRIIMIGNEVMRLEEILHSEHRR